MGIDILLLITLAARRLDRYARICTIQTLQPKRPSPLLPEMRTREETLCHNAALALHLRADDVADFCIARNLHIAPSSVRQDPLRTADFIHKTLKKRQAGR